MAFLTTVALVVAALPQEMGNLAAVLSPEAQKYVALGSAIATAFLRLSKRFIKPADTAPATPPTE